MYKFADFVLFREGHYNVKLQSEVIEDVKTYLTKLEKMIGEHKRVADIKDNIDSMHLGYISSYFYHLILDLHAGYNSESKFDDLFKEGWRIYNELKLAEKNNIEDNMFALSWERPNYYSPEYITRANYNFIKKDYSHLKDVNIKGKLFEYIDKFEDELRKIKSRDGWELLSKLTKNIYDMHQWQIFLDFMEENGVNTEEIRSWVEENLSKNPPQEYQKDDLFRSWKGWGSSN